MIRDLDMAAATLDKVRPGGADDMKAVLDRASDPARESQANTVGKLREAWVEEGRLRTQPAVYAHAFVTDWKAASEALSMARTASDEARAERRVERLENRMVQEPALERALDRVIPERQLGITEPGASSPVRERDFDMGI
jgi:hypothetical protein